MVFSFAGNPFDGASEDQSLLTFVSECAGVKFQPHRLTHLSFSCKLQSTQYLNYRNTEMCMIPYFPNFPEWADAKVNS